MTSIWKQALELRLACIGRRPEVDFVRVLASAVFSAALILSLSACGSSSNTTVKSVAISPTSTSVNLDQQVTFNAVVTLNNSSTSTTTTVTWEVNGSTSDTGCGTIAPSPDDQLEGVYTAPAVVPSGSCGVTGGTLGQVAIIAVTSQTGTSSSASSTSSTSGTLTSNTAIVTVGTVLGLTVSPPSAGVPAGGTQQFSAILNGLAAGASWSLSSTLGGNLGSIDSNGLYTAPPFPPPSNSLTVTATATGSGGSSVTATATVTVSYSDHSLSGPYAFSYTGNDGSGFFAVAGSFVADGNGKIVSGVEDIQSFLTGSAAAVPLTGSYSVGSGGRGSASITTDRGTASWRFALSTNLHAELTRFDTNVTGGGSIDQQTLNATNSSDSVISGRYAFNLLGLDGSSNPLGIAGEFLANGSGGVVNTDAILDLNDNGLTTAGDTTLTGSYSFDNADSGTGRGTLTLQSAAFGPNPRTFTFYAIGTPGNCTNQNSVCQLHLIETDASASTAGDMSFASTTPGLANPTYVFTAGGNSGTQPYAAGGVFMSDGVSTISGGTLDLNSGGTYNKGVSLNSCSFTSNSGTGRVLIGPCASNSGLQFSAYPTALGSVVLLELDSSVATGIAYQQCGPQSTGCAANTPSLSADSVGFGLIGQGLFHGLADSPSFQSDLDGQLAVSTTTLGEGNLDINDFTGTFPTDPVGTSGTSIGGPTNGRGTITLAATNPTATYNMIYYLIDDHTALLFSSGQSPVAIGLAARQF
jgi:hypothetical protein